MLGKPRVLLNLLPLLLIHCYPIWPQEPPSSLPKQITIQLPGDVPDGKHGLRLVRE